MTKDKERKAMMIEASQTESFIHVSSWYTLEVKKSILSWDLPTPQSELHTLRQPTINNNIRPRHKCRPLARQKDNHISHLLRLAHPSQRILAHLLLEELGHTLLNPTPNAILDIDISRRNSVSPHAIRSILVRHLRCVMNKSSLHSPIRTRVSSEINDPPRHRRDGNHASFRFLQVRQSGVDEGVSSHHISAEGFVPVGRVVAHYQGRDVGDHGVYSAAFGRAALDPGCDVFGLRDVDDGAVGAVGGVGGGEVGFGAAAVVDCCAFGEEGLDDCFADGFGAAWDGGCQMEFLSIGAVLL